MGFGKLKAKINYKDFSLTSDCKNEIELKELDSKIGPLNIDENNDIDIEIGYNGVNSVDDGLTLKNTGKKDILTYNGETEVGIVDIFSANQGENMEIGILGENNRFDSFPVEVDKLKDIKFTNN